MESCRALILDDEPDLRDLIALTLEPMGVQCVPAATLSAARTALASQGPFHFCLTDMRLPDGNGLDLVALIQRQYPEMPVAVITAHGNVESAVEALKLGAFDFVSKPFDIATLRAMVDQARRLAGVPAGRDGGPNRPDLIGASPAMERVRSMIRKLARSQAPVFIGGESGTGKEVVARLIHASGSRAERPFVPVNCGAIPAELMESEFFGHRKGAFTGAVADKPGLFQAAHGGTLFLDEVAELPQAMQVKLLRAIQERAIRPIGGAHELPVDVRVLSASHRDLAAEVQAGRFRQDFYYRLNVIELRLPALRERGGDILPLADYLLDRLAREAGVARPLLAADALEALAAYDFPGNVRELENILERAFTLCEGEAIRAADLHLPARTHEPQASSSSQAESQSLPLPPGGVSDLEGYLESLEKEAIEKALEACRWNKTAAAEKLGISFRALRYRLKKLGME